MIDSKKKHELEVSVNSKAGVYVKQRETVNLFIQEACNDEKHAVLDTVLDTVLDRVSEVANKGYYSEEAKCYLIDLYCS